VPTLPLALSISHIFSVEQEESLPSYHPILIVPTSAPATIIIMTTIRNNVLLPLCKFPSCILY
ncbi:MAG: hypothetical protein WBZ20_17640, partial [Nitrososphaeraceae archaeon]